MMPQAKAIARPEPVRVLVVDDQAPIRKLVTRLLEARGFVCAEAENAEAAGELLRRERFQVLLSDVHMPPGRSGLALIENVLRDHPDVATIMVTAEDDPALAQRATDIGVYGYVLKPFQASQLMIVIANALRRLELEIANRQRRELLEAAVQERTVELRTALEQLRASDAALRAAHEETVNRLMRAAEFRDNETAQHIVRMGRYCELLARLYGMDAATCETLRQASPMHDIGKIGTPDNILLKPGKLTPDEFEIMKEHAEIGYRLIQGSGVPALEMGAVIAHTHHEKYDGSGYPRGLAGEAIPIEGRITAVADVFDALLSRRVYKDSFSVDDTLAYMRSQSGSHFDPELLALLLDHVEDALAIKRELPDD